jgi:ubiquinone/menaquinone biosynthesis C-methylase UbiE
MNLTDKNLREKEFHNALQKKSKGRFENIFYKALYNSSEDFFEFLKKNSLNSEILDYGCGVGQSLKNVIKFNPKKITGIDISEVSIKKAKESIQSLKSQAELIVDNCEKTKFENESFDIVYGSGILHHLDMTACINEIHRILKPGGKFLFIEPLGTNPLINFYRKLTPNSRSRDEHPLINQDFDLIEGKFKKTKIKYYGFLTLYFFPFYISPKNSTIFKLLKNCDQFLFKINLFKKLAWSTLIIAEKN